MEEKVSINDSCLISLRRGNNVIEERKVDGKQINLSEELWKILQCLLNTKEQ